MTTQYWVCFSCRNSWIGTEDNFICESCGVCNDRSEHTSSQCEGIHIEKNGIRLFMPEWYIKIDNIFREYINKGLHYPSNILVGSGIYKSIRISLLYNLDNRKKQQEAYYAGFVGYFSSKTQNIYYNNCPVYVDTYLSKDEILLLPNIHIYQYAERQYNL